MENIQNLLKELTSAVGVSGEEENIVKLLTEKLEAYGDVSVDDMNNVYCTFGEGYHFLLDAHLDEIGMIVTDITDDGFIKVNRCGGVDRRMLLGYEVSVWGNKEVKGVISTLPPHYFSDGMGEVIKYGCIKSASLFDAVQNRDAHEYIEDALMTGQVWLQYYYALIGLKKFLARLQ